MKRALSFALALSAALVAPTAYPCGAPFGNGINADPRQDIILVHKDGIETYVFQPRFCGAAKDFGLVLPVPGKLAEQPALAKPEVFAHLNLLSQPKYEYTTACMDWRNGVGVPGLRVDAGMIDAATVVSSGRVGFLDYAQLETSSVDALTAWLKANGYPYDEQATDSFAYYVTKGWFFVAFRVGQGTISGTNTCRDLGPIKLTFPSADPVVPTRMATARGKDTSGVLSSYYGFSWNIYGITAGAQQIGFADGPASNRELKYSGLLTTDDIGRLDGLAAAGDRADKLTITFNYGSKDPDIALKKTAGQDYREIKYIVNYVPCQDSGPEVAPPPEPGNPDSGLYETPPPLEPTVRKDAGADVSEDGARAVAPLPDAGVPFDAKPPVPAEPVVRTGGGGCSLAASTTSDGAVALIFLAVALCIARRRR